MQQRCLLVWGALSGCPCLCSRRSQDASLDHHRAKTAEETAAIIAAMDRSFSAGKDSASSFLVAVATSTDALREHAKLLAGSK